MMTPTPDLNALPYMNREVGQTVHLAVQKSSGEVRPLAVMAVPKLE